MRKMLAVVALSCVTGGIISSVQASPESDLKAFQSYFKSQFPDTQFSDFSNGVYAIDAASREQWEAIEEFPPYEIAIEEGEQIFKKPFKNGKTFASCFNNGGVGVAQEFPFFDDKRGEVVTLALAINECMAANDEKPFEYKKGKIASLLAYMGSTSRGNKIDVKIQNAAAREAYEDGKTYYYARRGQLNMACAHCHVDNAGKRIRADLLSPALGHPSHFPVYRSKWGGMGTLHRRFSGCNKQVRAKPEKAQSVAYRNLEYFLTYMSNGLDINAPGARK